MPERIAIDGGWIVAFDGQKHRIIENGIVVVEGDSIVYVGTRYDEPVARRIDARNDLVIPGLINAHVHIGSQAGDRMILDGGRRDMFRSGFLNHWPSKGIKGPNLFAFEDLDASLRYSLASLLRFGSTTVVEMGGEFGDDPMGIAKLAAELGIRVYTTPGFGSANHYFDQAGRLQRDWDEKAGEAGLDRAIAFIEEHDGDFDGLIRTILVPYEFWTTTPELLRRAKKAADTLKVPMTLHAAESVIEFQDTVLQTGRTPIGNLAHLDILGPQVILGHCMYTGGHSQTAYPFTDDIKLVAESGASVAHCPLVFARRGVKLESFQRYLDAGINVGLGTDSYPQDIIQEMQGGMLAAKLADSNHEVAKARDFFNAATLGGANALGRSDLGRLSKGAKADIVIVDFGRLRIGPFLDPIKALVQCGTGEIVKHVMVNGQIRIENGSILAWDEVELLARVRTSTDGAWAHYPDFHSNADKMDVVYPNAFQSWQGE
ncbi:MAG: chlorohydrolase family protein [Rhodospirillaceae bacterium]|nr:chlorohydrolase family protein [Rhodospirillaceae bacterium]